MTPQKIVVPKVGVFDRCPIRWSAEEGAQMQDMINDVHRLRRHRIWPEGGGLLDQHPRFLEVLAIFESILGPAPLYVVVSGGPNG